MCRTRYSIWHQQSLLFSPYLWCFAILTTSVLKCDFQLNVIRSSKSWKNTKNSSGHVVKCVKNNQILAICSITQAHSACIRFVAHSPAFLKSAYRDATDLGSISVSMSSKVEIHSNLLKYVCSYVKKILCDFVTSSSFAAFVTPAQFTSNTSWTMLTPSQPLFVSRLIRNKNCCIDLNLISLLLYHHLNEAQK